MITCKSISGLTQEFPDADSVEELPEYAQILVRRGKLEIMSEVRYELSEELPEPPGENDSKEAWAQYIADNFELFPDLSKMTRTQMIEYVRKNTQ